MVLGIIKIALRLRDWHVFMWHVFFISNVFNSLTLKEIFRKTRTFYKKLKYRFLVENTKIENALFPYKTAISEVNVKTNKMVTTKWTYHKEWSFSSNNFIFFKTLFQFKSPLQRFVVRTTQMPKFVLFVSAGVLRCFFPVSLKLSECTKSNRYRYGWLMLIWYVPHVFKSFVWMELCSIAYLTTFLTKNSLRHTSRRIPGNELAYCDNKNTVPAHANALVTSRILI